MQPRTAHRTAHDGAVPHPDGAAGLGAELAAVVAGARRRAVRDGDRQTDTAHLLHALLEHDPEARAAVGGPQRLARLLGYLVQRSIGYGLRWQGSVEDSGAIPLVPPPARPVDPTGAVDPAGPVDPAGRAGPDGAAVSTAGRDGSVRDTAGWSPAASAALADARARARRRGAPRVSGTDLLAALVADPRSRAVEVLERAGVPARELPPRIEAVEAVEYADGGGAAC
ncbi:Clp protease N-terminal domain-containing protein [Streptomyces tricolor]|uniref:Clp protease N-terminal domain-containing protein n=1 Tax=Streptomyces tricolor TaxID=68277 RepID=UPI003D7545F9